MATETRSPLKQLKCPNCSSPIEQFNVTTQAIVCPTCGSHVAIGTDDPRLLTKGQGRVPDSGFPIEMGDKATIGDVEFVVLGRVVYRGWDDEDSWTWHEWLMGGADGRMLWLSHDEKGFGLYQKLRFRSEFDPKRSFRLDVGKDKQAFIHERYPAEITGAEGELTWQAKRGERLFVAEGAGGGKRYSVQQTAEELEVYEGRLISESAIATAFKNQDWLDRLSVAKVRKGTARAIGILCILFAVMALLFAASVSGSGQEEEPRFMTLSSTQLSNSFTVNFEQTNRPAIVGIALRSGSLPANSFVDVDVNVISPDETKSYLFTQELWHETGRDEDGPWAESDYNSSDMFVPFQTGIHTFEVVFEPTASVNSVDLVISVRRNHIMPAWFVIYAVIAGIIGVIALFYGASKATAKS